METIDIHRFSEVADRIPISLDDHYRLESGNVQPVNYRDATYWHKMLNKPIVIRHCVSFFRPLVGTKHPYLTSISESDHWPCFTKDWKFTTETITFDFEGSETEKTIKICSNIGIDGLMLVNDHTDLQIKWWTKENVKKDKSLQRERHAHYALIPTHVMTVDDFAGKVNQFFNGWQACGMLTARADVYELYDGGDKYFKQAVAADSDPMTLYLAAWYISDPENAIPHGYFIYSSPTRFDEDQMREIYSSQGVEVSFNSLSSQTYQCNIDKLLADYQCRYPSRKIHLMTALLEESKDFFRNKCVFTEQDRERLIEEMEELSEELPDLANLSHVSLMVFDKGHCTFEW